MKFKLYTYNEDYYKIYEALKKRNFERIPSFREVKRLLAPQDAEIILDAGCGVGHQLNYYCGETAKGIGVDSSYGALKIASRDFPNFDFLQQDICNLGFKDEAFNKIVCFNVIEHIKDQDRAMHELRRVLKKNGILVISTNIKDSLCWRLYQLTITEHTHIREFTVKEFVKFVSNYFQIVEIKKSSGVFRIPAPFSWVFHYFLKGDIIVKAVKEK